MRQEGSNLPLKELQESLIKLKGFFALPLYDQRKRKRDCDNCHFNNDVDHLRIAFFACPTSDLPHLWTSSESLERHILGGVV